MTKDTGGLGTGYFCPHGVCPHGVDVSLGAENSGGEVVYRQNECLKCAEDLGNVVLWNIPDSALGGGIK